MEIQPDHIYYLSNRGNNAQPVFFSRNSYLLFLQRLHTYILPYADVLSWCLLPNNFHLMLYVNAAELELKEEAKFNFPKKRSFSTSVSLMLFSYIRGIRKKITGNFFQNITEAVCLTDVSDLIPLWYKQEYEAGDMILHQEKDYPALCFNYIHNAPVNEGLVNSAGEWEFSSFQDVTGLRNGRLINRDRLRKLGLIPYENQLY